ncbi:MAG: radical SAM protein [Candidatus Dormibacteria bacterium]
MILDLVREMMPLAEGMQARIVLVSAADAELARVWCERTGNTLVSAEAGLLTVQRGRPAVPAALPEGRRPGSRLWIYTNFDCNLACSYCCVRSSPTAPPRAVGAELIAQLAREAVAANVQEIYLTGGEPFIVPDIGESIRACAAQLPTTVLTNAMLFRGRRLEVLKSLPRTNLALQVSLDSPTPERHDRNRSQGSWARAVAGIELALELGFRVRIAATVDPEDAEAIADEPRFHQLLDRWAIAADDRLIRPWAKRGNADHGTAVTQEAILPEVTITADGVFWHPVAAADADMLVTTEFLPLASAIDMVTARFDAHRARTAQAAELFPCA